VKAINPEKHIDISSTLYFCSLLSTFIPVEFYDYRPAKLTLDNLESREGDLLNLPFETNSVHSISCMHTIEHVGLGRYGDPIDYDGDLKAIKELKRVTAVGGNILFVVPLGASPRIFFNAHRIYTKDQVVDLFSDFKLQEFALIPEDENDGGLVVDPDPDLLRRQVYGCGCFWFVKQ
jgi:SAM-dependent methyltransferase